MGYTKLYGLLLSWFFLTDLIFKLITGHPPPISLTISEVWLKESNVKVGGFFATFWCLTRLSLWIAKVPVLSFLSKWVLYAGLGITSRWFVYVLSSDWPMLILETSLTSLLVVSRYQQYSILASFRFDTIALGLLD